MTDWDGFLTALESRGSAPALIEADGQVTQAAALALGVRQITHRANALRLAGRRVALILPDRLEAAALILSLTQVCSVLPLNPALPKAELRRQLQDAQADLLLFHSDFQTLARDLGIPAAPVDDGLPDSLFLPPAKADVPPGLVLTTSGSTGQPKRVPLSAQALMGSARNIARTLELGPEDRAISALPVFHIGALVDLLLAPLLAGGSGCASAGKTPADLQNAVLNGRGTWLQLVPTMLARCLSDWDSHTGARIGAQLSFVRMVSADLSPEMQAKAESFLAGTPLIQMYGMTETAGQIASNPRPPGARVPGSVGRAAGAELAILDANGTPVPEGEICVRGPSVMAGYEGTDTPRHGPWLRTGDTGRLDAAGRLFLTGRLKEIINRGGEKISPLTVERAALRLPGVTQAVAYALPHKTLGQHVGLSVTAPGLTEADILRHLSQELAEFERPRQVRLLNDLPRLGSGKVDRLALAQMETNPTLPPPAPLTGTAKTVSRVWARTLDGAAPSTDSDFFDDGGDSLSATEFLLALEKALGRPLPPNLLFDAPRFGDLVTRLDSHPAPQKARHPAERFILAATSAWPGTRAGPNGLLILRNADAPGVPVFFGVNDRAQADRLSQTLGADRPFYILRSLLHGGRAKLGGEARIARLIARDIQALHPQGRLVLGGFCEGAGLMHRVAGLLGRQGRTPDLFLSVDWEIPHQTPLPMVFIWTNSRWFSPFGRFDRPGRALHDAYPNGAIMHHIPQDHEQAMTPRAFAPVAAKLRPFLDGRRPPRFPKREDILQPAREARWRGHIRLRSRLPRVLTAGSTYELPVTATNRSPVPWPASDTSALGCAVAFIGPRLLWRGPRYPWYRRVFGPRQAISRFPTALASGGCQDLTLLARAPHRPGWYLMRISLLEDGFKYFLNGRRTGIYRLVRVVKPD